VHWKPQEAEQGVRLLVEAGFDVNAESILVSGFLRQLENEKPDAVLIDLSRAPSQGRDLGVSIRMRKGTRHIPLVFVGGKPEKVEAIRELLPDAGFTDWENVAARIEQLVKDGVPDPIVPDSVFAAYAGKLLAEKLGIKPSFVVAHVGAPSDFVSTLGELPEGSVVVEGPDQGANLTVWFVRSAENLSEELPGIVDTSKHAPVWIAWPKKGSKLESDLAQQIVRERGMAEGMVDYKICSIDVDWSALLFKWRGRQK
jgi:CheY-like chemotaxis protein